MSDVITKNSEKILKNEVYNLQVAEKALKNQTFRYCKMLIKDLKTNGIEDFKLSDTSFINVLISSSGGKLGIKLRPNISIRFSVSKNVEVKNHQKLVNELKSAFPRASVGPVTAGSSISVYQEYPDNIYA